MGDLYPGEALQDQHVMVVGIGALGATVARKLAASGVGRLTLVDHDEVQPGNLMRHEARMPDIGLRKVSAVEKIIHETNPYVEVDIIKGSRLEATKLEACLSSLALSPKLIIVTVAIKAVDGQIDDLVRRSSVSIPVLHAWVVSQAQVLRSFVYIPGKTACFWCNSLYDRDAKEGRNDAYLTEPSVENQSFFETSCSSPAFPGAGNSNGLAAHVITEMGLDVLLGRLKEEESHWIFAGNRIHELDSEYPVSPLTISRRGFPPHPECPVCFEGWLGGIGTEAERNALLERVDRLRGQG